MRNTRTMRVYQLNGLLALVLNVHALVIIITVTDRLTGAHHVKLHVLADVGAYRTV
jgi:hypothetical protein